MVKIVNNTPFASFEDYKNQALAAGYPSYINPEYKPFSTLTINGQNRASEITFEKLFDPNFETLFPGIATTLTVRHRTSIVYDFYTLRGYSLTLEAETGNIVLSGSIHSTGQIYDFYPSEEEFNAKVVSSSYPSDLIFEKSFKGGKYRRQGNSSSSHFYEVLNSLHYKNVYSWRDYYEGSFVARRYFYNLKIGAFDAFSRGFIGENNAPYNIQYENRKPVYFGVELTPSELPEYRSEIITKINSGEIFFTPASPLKNIEISGDYGALDDGFGKFYENLLIPNGATVTFYDERIRLEKPLRIEVSSGITTSYDEFGNLSITNNDDSETGYLKLYKSEPGPDPDPDDPDTGGSDEDWWAMIQSSGSLK